MRAMQIGIFAPTTDYALPAHELAQLCEARGFESFPILARLDRYAQLAHEVS
jgi:hypothetical protein